MSWRFRVLATGWSPWVPGSEFGVPGSRREHRLPVCVWDASLFVRPMRPSADVQSLIGVSPVFGWRSPQTDTGPETEANLSRVYSFETACEIPICI